MKKTGPIFFASLLFCFALEHDTERATVELANKKTELKSQQYWFPLCWRTFETKH